MGMRRRIFLQGLAGTLALTSIAAKKPEKKKTLVVDRDRISVLMGPAFDGYAEFSIVHCRTSNLRYSIYEDSQFIYDASFTSITSPYDDFKVDKFLLQNLPIAKKLTLKVFDGDKQIDERYFKSINSDKRNMNIGIASCMRAGYHDKAIWDSLESQKSDLILFLGDCVYVDFDLAGNHNPNTTPKDLWIRYVEARMILQCYQWKNLVPIVATWDDHDVGGNDVLSNYPFLKFSQETFRTFFAQSLTENHYFTSGPGISSLMKLGGHLFAMMDGRSYRLESKPGLLFSFFGKEQEDWFFDSIKDCDSTIWLANGTQWFNKKGFGDSFRKHHPINFNGFIERLNHLDKRVIFLAGDMHFSEICNTPPVVKNKSLELTSSCMHSSSFVGLPQVNRNEDRIAATGLLNFLVCQLQETNDWLILDIDCVGRNRQRIFKVRNEFKLTT